MKLKYLLIALPVIGTPIALYWIMKRGSSPAGKQVAWAPITWKKLINKADETYMKDVIKPFIPAHRRVN